MYSDISKLTDTIQLQQKVIYFKAELAKYQMKVKSYENDYHYSQLKKLKEENLQLIDVNNALSLNNVELQMNIDNLIKEQELNQKKLYEFKQLLKDSKVKDNQINKLNDKLAEALEQIQQYEKALSVLNQEKTELLSFTRQLEKKLVENQTTNIDLTNKIAFFQEESEKYSSLQRTHEILRQEMKSSQENLNEMFIKFKETNFEGNPTLTEGTSPPTNIDELFLLKQLECQFKELLAQAFEYEEKLDSNIIIINELENKLNDLTSEIEEVQNSIHEESNTNKVSSELTS